MCVVFYSLSSGKGVPGDCAQKKRDTNDTVPQPRSEQAGGKRRGVELNFRAHRIS